MPGLDMQVTRKTSYLLHHRPDLVDMSKAVAGQTHISNMDAPLNHVMHLSGPYGHNSILFKSSHQEFAERTAKSYGVTGDATRATAEKGAHIFEAVVANSCAFIESIRRTPVVVRDISIPI